MKIQGIVTTTVLTLALIIISTTTAAALSCSDCDICFRTTPMEISQTAATSTH